MATFQHKSGFTLIELVVVIIILAILAVIAAPKFLDFRTDSKIATLEGVAGAMASGLALVHSKAAIEGQDVKIGSIVHAGVTIPLYNGYPSVRGRDDWETLNDQVQAWLDIDSVSLTEIEIDNDAAPFFIDKSTANNQIYIFFAEDLADKSVNFNCHILYQNPVSTTNYEIFVRTDEC
ncbi:prepilin-type N-terminal cleavage/methylation domain-containing protein [Shewanella sp. KX20019]|uniref:prepilin-type N-terminal cleavage/methylation domain-containing protein n=1 Tax=Shewanella sp. KX20019 TaxID=2803864 RepID=UPI0019269B76|nr:prepilin-type N-terminal cleavage/methylation domain-containing protein [Shewanella sp. KX20019]QQX78880.1 prepilin-type N-terminal cleavage/methylation domain-containing protein [Shewanella sp. KX20019]